MNNPAVIKDKIIGLCRRASGRYRIVLTGHAIPDFDSVASCVLMKGLLMYHGIPSVIILSGTTDVNSARSLGRYGIDSGDFSGNIGKGDALLLLDHNKSPYEESAGVITAAVDHHIDSGGSAYPVYTDLHISSCAFLVWKMLAPDGLTGMYETELAVASVFMDTFSMRSAKAESTDTEICLRLLNCVASTVSAWNATGFA